MSKNGRMIMNLEDEVVEPKSTTMQPDDDSDEPEWLATTAHTPEANAKRDAHPNWRGVTLAPEELFERREYVYQMRERGHTWREIAEDIGFSLSTARSDYLWMQKIKKDDANEFSEEEYLATTIVSYDDVMTRGWKIYEKTSDPDVKLRALNQIRMTLNDKRKALTDLGAIRQKEQKHVIQVNHALVDNWDDELQERVRGALLEAQMETPLLDPVSPEELGITEAEIVVDKEDEEG